MRKTAISIALSLACVGLASAWNTEQEAPEARAYATLSFGDVARGDRESFFYGMRLDVSEQSRREGRPAMAQLQFNRHGFSEARVNGVPFAYTVRLAQNEGGEGGDSSPGTFSNFTFIDWTLLAVGAAAIGYGIAEVVDQEDTPDPSGGATTGGGTTGTTTGGGTTGTPLGGVLGGTTTGTPTGGTTTGTPLGGVLGGVLGGTYRSALDVPGESRSSREYQEWLDGGSGQMGDLHPR